MDISPDNFGSFTLVLTSDELLLREVRYIFNRVCSFCLSMTSLHRGKSANDSKLLSYLWSDFGSFAD